MDVSAGGVSTSANGAGGGPVNVPTSADSQTHTSTQATPPAQTAKDAPVDPEWEFDGGKKLPRSKALERIKNFEKGAYQAMQRAAEASNTVKELQGHLQSFGVSLDEYRRDPIGALKKAANAHVAREVDESLLDPKEREMTQRERQLAEREERINAAEEKRNKEESETRATARADQIAESLAPAMQQAGLPANTKTVARMADAMLKAYRKGIKINPAEAAEYVAWEIGQEQDWHLSQAADAKALVDRLGQKRIDLILDQDPASLAQLLGQKRLDGLREYMLAQRASQQPTRRVERPTVTQPETAARKYIGWEEYSKQRKGL